MANDRGLIIRHSTRHEIALPCELSVAVAHQGLVRLSPSVALTRGRVAATLVDASAGGLGVISEVFFPKQTLLELRVLDAVESDAPPLLCATLRVKRVLMTDRCPGYLLGLSFEVEDDASERMIGAFLSRLEEAERA